MTWGLGYQTGISAGIWEAIHRIRDMQENEITDINLILDYLEKDASWSMQEVDGWDGIELMDSANGWKPGWWNANTDS